MIIANNNEQDKELVLDRFNEMLAGKSLGIEITNSNTYSMKRPLTIPAKTVLILDVK